ncbi:MAG: hypothetical protein R2751_11875 [Bacteroidales bacterium]
MISLRADTTLLWLTLSTLAFVVRESDPLIRLMVKVPGARSTTMGSGVALVMELPWSRLPGQMISELGSKVR